MLKNKNLRLAVAGLFLVLSFGLNFADQAEASGGDCWFCISYDLCEESILGSQGCTVTSGGHGCQYQCQEIGGPCFPGM